MGTFVGHVVPGLALAVLGLWQTINTIRAFFLNGPNNFAARFWYPFKTSVSNSKLQYLELIIILFISILAITMEVLDFPNFLKFSFKLISFEHATMFLHLAIFSGFTLFAELTHISESTHLSSILAASVFGQELFLLHFHSADHVGLEGHYHFILQLIVLVSFLTALCCTMFPSSFPSSILLSISVVFQGCWFMNMGFMLWYPDFVPRGCSVHHDDHDSSGSHMHGTIACGTHEAEFRAKALANLQFSWILASILILVGIIYLSFARRFTTSRQSIQYAQLQSRGGGDVAIAFNGLKQVQVHT